MRPSIIIFILTLALSFSLSCDKNDELITMHFNETACANPWSQDSEIHVANNDPDYQNKVEDFLKLHGIDVETIAITNDGPWSGCFSCFCTSGRRISISINEKQKALAIELGFTLD